MLAHRPGRRACPCHRGQRAAPLPADVIDAEPSSWRRRIVPLTAAGTSVVAAVAATVVVLSSSAFAHKPSATAGPPWQAHVPATRELTIDQLRAGDCLQGPPDINTARSWPNVVTAIPCADKHLAEVYFFSANYWPTGMAFPSAMIGLAYLRPTNVPRAEDWAKGDVPHTRPRGRCLDSRGGRWNTHRLMASLGTVPGGPMPYMRQFHDWSPPAAKICLHCCFEGRHGCRLGRPGGDQVVPGKVALWGE